MPKSSLLGSSSHPKHNKLSTIKKSTKIQNPLSHREKFMQIPNEIEFKQNRHSSFHLWSDFFGPEFSRICLLTKAFFWFFERPYSKVVSSKILSKGINYDFTLAYLDLFSISGPTDFLKNFIIFPFPQF